MFTLFLRLLLLIISLDFILADKPKYKIGNCCSRIFYYTIILYFQIYLFLFSIKIEIETANKLRY